MRFKIIFPSLDEVRHYQSSNGQKAYVNKIRYFDNDNIEDDRAYILLIDTSVEINDQQLKHPVVGVSKYGTYGNTQKYVGDNYHSISTDYVGQGLSKLLLSNDLDMKRALTKKIISSGSEACIQVTNTYSFTGIGSITIKPTVLRNTILLSKMFPDIKLYYSTSIPSRESLEAEIARAEDIKKMLKTPKVFGRPNDFTVVNYILNKNPKEKYVVVYKKTIDETIQHNCMELSKKQDDFFFVVHEDTTTEMSGTRVNYHVVECRGRRLKTTTLSLPAKRISNNKSTYEDNFNFGYSGNISFDDIDINDNDNFHFQYLDDIATHYHDGFQDVVTTLKPLRRFPH